MPPRGWPRRFRDQENLADAIARLCVRYGEDAVLAEATKHKNQRDAGETALAEAERKNPLYWVEFVGVGARRFKEVDLCHVLFEIARRLEQDRALRPHTAANAVVRSERDSGLWHANWTIVYELDERLKNVAKGSVRPRGEVPERSNGAGAIGKGTDRLSRQYHRQLAER
jgi:hypothetical protein